MATQNELIVRGRHDERRERARRRRIKRKRAIWLLIVLAISHILAGIVGAKLGSGPCYQSGYQDGYQAGYRARQDEEAEEEALVSELYGVDISSYNEDFIKVIDSERARDFVICRATSGYEVDKTCDRAYQYAKSQGKLLGVYFWGDSTELNPRKYAAFCVGTVQGYISEAMFVLDFESPSGEALDPEWAKEWMEEFEALTGVKPLIYMNSYVARELDWSSVVAGGYRLWVASYGKDDGANHGLPDGVGQWSGQLAMHQYTTYGLGARESLDLDVFFGSRADWLKLITQS